MAKKKNAKAAKKKGVTNGRSKATHRRRTVQKRAPEGKRLAGWELVDQKAVFKHLKSAKISVGALSKTLGVSASAVYSWKAGRRVPSTEAQRKLAGILSGETQTAATRKTRTKRSRPTFDASNLRSTREARGLSREALATQLGVSPSSLFNWESGKSSPRGGSLAKLSGFLNDPGPGRAAPTVASGESVRRGPSSSPRASIGAAQVASAYLAAGQPLTPSQVVTFVRELRDALS